MSDYISDHKCPSCGELLFASDQSRKYGYRNPYVYYCECGKAYRWTDIGEETLVRCYTEEHSSEQ